MYYYSPFRADYGKSLEGCPFCDNSKVKEQIILREDGSQFENEHWLWMVNLYPKFEGHTMLVPKRHFTDLTEETPGESVSRQELAKEAISVIRAVFPNCGIEYFAQNGKASLSSVSHIHWHIVPASADDDLRSFEKLGHFYTTKPKEEKVLIFPKIINMGPGELREKLSGN